MRLYFSHFLHPRGRTATPVFIPRDSRGWNLRDSPSSPSLGSSLIACVSSTVFLYRFCRFVTVSIGGTGCYRVVVNSFQVTTTWTEVLCYFTVLLCVLLRDAVNCGLFLRQYSIPTTIWVFYLFIFCFFLQRSSVIRRRNSTSLFI